MELVRLRGFGEPSFACAPAPPPQPPAYHYEPSSVHGSRQESQETAAKGPGAAPLSPCDDHLLQPFLQPNPANFAALRCEWTHPAVINLVMAQSLPGISLTGAASRAAAAVVPAAPLQQRSLWNSMLPALSGRCYPIYPSQQLHSLYAPRVAASGPQAAQQPGSTALAQPSICVGHEDDWLELSPAMLPLWPAVPFEPFAGQKPVQCFVLCPEELQSQALLFIKDVGAQYELCGLGGHHSAPQPPWLYSFSSVLPPECSAHGPQCAVWARLSRQQRYLVGLRAAAQRLQRALLTTPLHLRQEGPALEINLGSAPVVYVVCPFDEGQQQAAMVEVACCLAPCTPAGASCQVKGSDQGSGQASSGGAGSKSAGFGGVRLDSGGPATPDPGGDRFAGATPCDAPSPPVAAAAPGDAAAMGGVGAAGARAGVGAGAEAQGALSAERYYGAAECLFRQEQGGSRNMAAREFPRGAAPPLDLTLQLLGPRCLSDLSSQAAKATAFELYSKIRRRPQDTCSQQQGQQQQGQQQHQGVDRAGTGAGPMCRPPVPFCSEPLFTLARSAPACVCAQPTSSPQQPHQPQTEGQGSTAAGAQQHRTLHCCYSLPPDLGTFTVERPGPDGAGSHCKVLLVPAAWTDSCGELLHCQVLEVELEVELESSSPNSRPYALACSAVAQHSAALLSYLRSATQPPNLLQHLVISRLGEMPAKEGKAWEQLVTGPLLQALSGVTSSPQMSILALEAAPPARLAAASGPPGGACLMLKEGPCGGYTGGALIMLPNDDPGALTLPGEHDTVRALELTFVGAGGPSGVLGSSSSGGGCGSGAWAQEQALPVATELYNLSVLNAAHFHLLLGSCTLAGGLCAVGGDGGGAPPPTAHLPLHAHMVERMLRLLDLLCSGGGGGSAG